MILLKLISWPYARKHLLRSLLTAAGIVLGVAVFVGMHTANRSVLAAFNQTVDKIAGATQLQISAGEAGFSEDVLERVQSSPDVRVAVPVIESVVNTGLAGQGNLLILAVDMTGDRALRDYDVQGDPDDVVDDPLVFLAQPDSLIVTREFAARNGLSVNSKLPMQTMDGEKRFTVRGIMKSGGLTSAFGGNIAVMDVYAAQKVFGRGRKFDRIDIAVASGVSIEKCQSGLRSMLGPAFLVEPPSGRGQQFESLVLIFSAVIDLSSLFALVIGMFIIYNSFAIAVTQRRFEIGILRALGATRRQIRTLFLAESAIAGVIASVAGVFCGLLVARAMAVFIGSIMENIYGMADRTAQVNADPKLIAVALTIGIATSMLAAFLPSRNAARVDPVKALQKGRYQVLTEGENRMRRVAAGALGLLSFACMLLGKSSAVFYAGYALLVITALLLTPAFSSFLSRLLRLPLKWLLPVEGALAADSLIQSPRRTSGTVAALMLALSMVIGLGGMARASYDSIQEWLRSTLNPDLFVSASENLVLRAFHFPASMEAELQQVPGIAEVEPVRSVRMTVRGKSTLLIATQTLKVANRTRERHVIAGDYARMHRVAAEGRGVVVAENFARHQKMSMGDIVEIPSPTGMLRLPIAGILRDYSDQQGTIFMDQAVYRRYWNDDTVDVFRIYLKPGASAEDVKRGILNRFAGQRRLFVFFNDEVKRWVIRLTDQWFGMTYLQTTIAVLVAVLGIVNTLTVSIADRRRELGVLRAVGGLRIQIRRTLWMEALAIGVIGLALGLGFGAINLLYQLIVLGRDFAGMSLDYEYPGWLASMLVPVILTAAFASALAPAESAVRGSLVEALEYE